MKHSTSYAWFAVAFLAAELVGSPSQAGELVRGPYLQIPTSHSIIIRWRTDVPTESVVFYGLGTNSLSFSATDNTPTNDHIVGLSGLTPATRYYYSIGSATQTLAAGIDYRFLTSPAAGNTGPTRVWAFGDSGGETLGNTNARIVSDSYVQYLGTNQTDVWLLLGDLAYEDGTDSQYQTNFFAPFGGMLRQLAPWTTIGNHEVYSVPVGQRFPYLDTFSFPTNGEAGGVASGREEYYSFDHANIHFVCLDSQTQSRATNGVMANWLRADLAANTNQWTVAFFHHAPYSKGTHDSDNASWDPEMVEMRQNIVPILEGGGVDLVLTGHSHDYERSYLLHGHYGNSTALSPEMILDPGSGRENETGAYIKTTSGPLANRGAVYVVAGTGCCVDYLYGQHPAMYIGESQVGSLVFEINSNRLDAVFLRETGAIDDAFTILKEAPRTLVWSGAADSTTWDLAANNWSNTVAQVNGDVYHSGDMVRFDDTTTNRSVTLSRVLTPSSAVVDTVNMYQFAGPGVLSGPTGLMKKGVGTLQVGTINDYSGQTTISNGTLSISGGNAIGDSSAMLLANVATASLIVNNSETIGSLAGGGTTGGNVFLNSGTLTTGGNGDSTTYAANISGTGNFSKAGDGTMTLTGFTVLLGGLWVNSGTLVVDASGFVSTFSSQSIGANTGDNGMLTLKGSSTYAVANDFTIGDFGNSVGTLNVTNNASLTVTRFFVGAANGSGSTASGTVYQSGGTVTETSTSLGDFVIGGRSPNSANGVGVYNLSAGMVNANAGVSVGDWGSGTVNQSGGTFFVGSTDGGIILQRNPGPGGTYNLNGGTLKSYGILTGVGASDPSFNSVFNFNGGDLQPTANNGGFMQALTRANVRDGGAVIDTAGFNITINQPLLQSDLSGDVGTGGLIKNGSGTLTLSGVNTYRGGTFLTDGKLHISADNNLGFATGSLAISNGATLETTANVILSSTRQLLLGGPGGIIQPDGSQVSAILDVAAGTTADVRSRILGTNDNGTARFMKTGGGVMVLNNLNFNNAFSGGIYLHGGLTKTAPGPQFGDSILTQDNGAGIISDQDGVFDAPTFIGSGSAVRESGLGYTVYRNGPVLNVNNLVSFGGLTVQGDELAGDPSLNAGKVGLGGQNTFGGVGQAVIVNTNFTLAISRDTNLGNIANRLILKSGILAVEHGAASDGSNASVAVAANVTTARRIELTGNCTINVLDQSDPKNASVASVNNGTLGTMTINAPGLVTGTGSLTKAGPGTLVINSANNYTGGTILNDGQLNVSADNNLGLSTTPLTIGNGATLESTAGFFTSRQIFLGGRGTTLQADGNTASAIINVTNGATLDLRGRILGTVGGDPVLVASRLVKTGEGTLFLNNLSFNNAFSGGIYLHGGLTKTGPGPQFGDSILTQDQGAKIICNQDAVFNSISYIGTGGAVRESGLGYTAYRNGPVLNVNNVGSFGGVTLQGDEIAGDPSLHAGKVGLGGVNTFGGLGQAVVVNTNFTLSICRDANLGSLANRLVLNSSTLAVEHGATSDGTNPALAVAAVVNTAREIDISGNVTIFVSSQSDPKNDPVAASNDGIPGQMTVSSQIANGPAGPGSLIKAGVGTLTLTGANTYSGNTTVNGGTLACTQPRLNSNSTITVASGGVLKLDFVATNTVAGLVLNGITKSTGIYNSGNGSPFLSGAGSLLVSTAVPSPAVLTNNVSGNILNFSWPAGQNWTLQTQTNSLSTGLSTNWVDVPGSTTFSATNITIDVNQPATFYRLKK